MDIVTLRRKNLRAAIDAVNNAKGFSSDAAFCEHYDLNPSQISQLVKGHGSFGERAARNLERKIGWDTGFLDNATSEPPQNASQIEDWDSDTPLNSDEIDIVFYKDLKFACGDGLENEAHESESRRLRISRKTLDRIGATREQIFAATSSDNSMSPTIEDGDTVYVHMGKNKVKDGKIFAIEHGGLFRCKRLYQIPNGGVRIVSDNKDEYGEEILTAEQIKGQNFRIIGWVWSWQTMDKW